MRRKMP